MVRPGLPLVVARVNISDFLEKQNYVDAVMEVTGSDKVKSGAPRGSAHSFQSTRTSCRRFRILRPITLSQQQKREAAAKPAKPKNSSTNATASERACLPTQ